MPIAEFLKRKPRSEAESGSTSKELFADIQRLSPQFSDGLVVFNSATLSNRLDGLTGVTKKILPFEQGKPAHVYFTTSTDDRRINSLRLVRGIWSSERVEFHLRDRDFALQKVTKGDNPQMEVKPNFSGQFESDFVKILVAIKEDLEIARESWRQSVSEERDNYLDQYLPSIHRYAKDRVASVLNNIRLAFRNEGFIVLGAEEKPNDKTNREVDLFLNIPINEEAIVRLEKARTYSPTVNHEKVYTRRFPYDKTGIFTITYSDGLTMRLSTFYPRFVQNGSPIDDRGDLDESMSPLEKDFARYLRNRQKHFYGSTVSTYHGYFSRRSDSEVLLLANPNENPVGKIFEDLRD